MANVNFNLFIHSHMHLFLHSCFHIFCNTHSHLFTRYSYAFNRNLMVLIYQALSKGDRVGELEIIRLTLKEHTFCNWREDLCPSSNSVV